MGGETDINILISEMRPILNGSDFVFCTTQKKLDEIIGWHPWAIIREKEANTIIVTKEIAEENDLPYESIFKCITLSVHSSLDAVGLTAAVSSKLARSGISANIVAGYFHDHIFIQKEKAVMAMNLLDELSRQEI